MIFGAIIAGVTKIAGTAAAWATAHAPGLLLAAETVSVGAGVYCACKATTRASAILEHYEAEEKKLESQVLMIKEKQEKEAQKPVGQRDMAIMNYDERMHRHDLLRLKEQLIFRMAKNYAAAAACFGAAIVFKCLGFHIMSNRIAVLAASYASLSNAFQAYQARVKAVLGADEEARIRNGYLPVKVENATVDGEEVRTEVLDENHTPLEMPFEIVIDEGHPLWNKDIVYLHDELCFHEFELNKLLETKMVVTWNETCSELDETYKPTKQGYMFGWSNIGMDKQEILARRMDRIDLGIERAIQEAKACGNLRRIVLHPNLDGFIYDSIPEDECLKVADERRTFTDFFQATKNKAAVAIGWKKATA